MSKTKNIKTSLLLLNTGQIEGLPKNSRFIRDNRYQDLLKSIQDDPEMIDYRTLLVYPFEDKFVVICGNMRLRACKELGYKELPCYVLPADTTAEKLRAYSQKDNVSFGQNDWDLLANEWDLDELKSFGVECDFLGEEMQDIDDLFEDDNSEKKEKDPKITISVPKQYEDKIEDIKKAVGVTLKEWAGCVVG